MNSQNMEGRALFDPKDQSSNLPARREAKEEVEYTFEDLERDFGKGVYDVYMAMLPKRNYGEMPNDFKETFVLVHQHGGHVNCVPNCSMEQLKRVLKVESEGMDEKAKRNWVAYNVEWRPLGSDRTRDFQLAKKTPFGGMIVGEAK